MVADLECRPGPGLAWLGSVTTSERRPDTESCRGIPTRRHTGRGAPRTFRIHGKRINNPTIGHRGDEAERAKEEDKAPLANHTTRHGTARHETMTK